VTGKLASRIGAAYSRVMRSTLRAGLFGLLLWAVSFTEAVGAATKVHIITFGKWTSAQWFPGTGVNDKPVAIKVRALIVDGRVKEYVLGSPHEVTDRLFVVRRVFRVNDGLPEDTAPQWQWQRGGWLLVDRVTGRISPINLPEFDALYSSASWYRDYVAYCGVSDDGKKTYAVVVQISRRKPVLKKALSDNGVADDAGPDSACPAPVWQRSPVRVSYEPAGGAKQTFAIRGHVVDVVNDTEEEEEASK
jgi:hypothetical protein